MADDFSFGAENETLKKNTFLPHSNTVFFHCLFRFAAIVIYMFGGLFISSFVTTFIMVLLLLSADFWTVKNVSGRLLVGLRWWNQVDDDGQSRWIFESRSQRSLEANPVNSKESTVFWFTLFICPVIWVLLFITAFFSLKLSWLPLVIIAVTLNGANLFGYLRCKFSGTQQISKIANDYFAANMMKRAFSMVPGFGGKAEQNNTGFEN